MVDIIAYDFSLLVNQVGFSYLRLEEYPASHFKLDLNRDAQKNYVVVRCDCKDKYLPKVFKWLKANNIDYDSVAPKGVEVPNRHEDDIVAIDMDGTTTKGVCWEEKDCEKAKLTRFSKKIKSFYDKSFVVIWTARKDKLIPATLKHLRENNIPFHAISTEKMVATLYIDDKTYNPYAKKAKRVAQKILMQ